MQLRTLAIAALAAAFALTALPASTVAQQNPEGPRVTVKKQTTKKRVARPARPAGQIACTAAGCGRIPPNCYPTPGMRWDGMPSGFDVIICR
ncbi:MAG: hypothetical protein Q8M24_04935 [Pseudolabrys sp.]|nr:hypothetical protein [Pseudolabrys sp.]MDP2294790.1 hypothetical protein [Pseudolabrys sp.]